MQGRTRAACARAAARPGAVLDPSFHVEAMKRPHPEAKDQIYVLVSIMVNDVLKSQPSRASETVLQELSGDVAGRANVDRALGQVYFDLGNTGTGSHRDRSPLFDLAMRAALAVGDPRVVLEMYWAGWTLWGLPD